MASAESIRNKAQDCIDALEAIVRRATTAQQASRPPSRKPDHQPKAKGHTDPTGSTALDVVEVLEQVDVSLMDVKQECYRLAGFLNEWAPARRWDNDVRRCTVQDCAKEHKAMGLCDMHYRRAKRAEERKTA